MNFLKPVSGCVMSEIANGLLMSDEVEAGKVSRHTIAILATSDCRIGNVDVLKSKTKGIKLAEDEQIIIPVQNNCKLYINGSCDLVEFY